MGQPLRPTLVPIFLPHLGCNRRCIYCNQSSITGTAGKETFAAQLEAGLSGRKEPVELALYSGNLFGVPVDRLVGLLDTLRQYRPLIRCIRISTKPVPLDERAIPVLKDAGVTVIELGMPSFNDRILALLNRGYTVEEFNRSYRRLKQEGFALGLQVMVGLPGETEDDLRATMANLSILRPSLLRIYPLLVLQGTVLHQLYHAGHFNPLTLGEAVERAALLYLHALRHDIPVIRMGLSGNEVLEEHVVAGPYHPAFGYLVRAHVFMGALTRAWETLGQPPSLKVTVNPRDIPHLTGHRRSHLERFRELGVQLSWETGDLDEGRFVAASAKGRTVSGVLEAPG